MAQCNNVIPFESCPSHEIKQQNTMNELERCVLCGKTTEVRKDTPVELRDDYIEGAGQLCHNCMAMVSKNQVSNE